MTIVLLLDPRAVLADTQTDHTPLDRWETSVVEEAGGWADHTPVYRRALVDWEERLMRVLGAVQPTHTAVASFPGYAPHAAAAKALAALPDHGIRAPLYTPDTASDLAKALDRIPGVSDAECIVIATGQRDAEYLDKLHSEVSWRTSVAPVIVNASRLGLLERDFNALADALGVEHPQKRV